MHILVVAGDRAICEAVRMAVEADGTRRATTTTAVDRALELLLRDPPDAAIADALEGPWHRGLVLARRAVDLRIPVLIMTDDAAARRELERVGCRYLERPFRLAALEAELRALMDEAALRTAELSMQLDRLAANRRDLGEAMAAARAAMTASQHALLAKRDRGGR